MNMIPEAIKRFFEYSGKIHRTAVKGFCGEFSKESLCGRLGVAGGILSSILLCLVSIVPYMPLKACWSIVLFVYIFFILLGLLFYIMARCEWHIGPPKRKIWIPAAAITLVLVGCFYMVLCLYGLDSSPDTQWQWEQVQAGKFDDWHPVIHTFSLYLLSRIAGSAFFVACVISASPFF